MSDVFISYAHETAREARAAAETLRTLGYTVWLDEDLPANRPFTHVLAEELTKAKAVLVIWSAGAAESDYVLSEASRARKDRKLVQVTTDKARLPMPFDTIHCVDLSGWSGEASHPGWAKVAARVADVVRGGRPDAAPGVVVAAAAPAEVRLAVLAFDNLSGEPDIAYFSDGVSEEVLQTVARGAELKVIGRGSSFQFRGADKAAAHVAATLRATHVLDGSVRRSGTRVRIAAHLIECAGETTLWSERYDRDLTDIFALQDEIAAAVAAALKIAISPGATVGPINPVAYDLYLKARETWRKTNSVATRVAVIGFLEPATALAPSFARAWAFLAEVQSIRLRWDRLDEPYAALRAKVIEAAETALNLDPNLGDVYQSLSRLEPLANYLEREKLHRKALAIAPNDPTVLTNASEFCAESGRNNEALEFATQARDLDPIYPWFTMWYANVLDCLGRNVDSRRVREESLTLLPDSEYEIWMSMASAAGHEDWIWFDELVRKSHIAGTYNGRVRGLVWYVNNIRDPNQESLRRFVQRVKVQTDELGRVSTNILRILCKFGYADEAFDLVDRASFTYMVDPEQRPPENLSQSIIFNVNYGKELMHDPRFPRLCSKLGLCDYWLQTDRWPDCADDGVLPYDFKAECRRLGAA